jgi:hypothetical protein
MMRILAKWTFLPILILASFVSAFSVSATTIAEYLIDKHDKLMVIEGHSQASPSSHGNYSNREKTLTLNITELSDNAGLIYLGGVVSSAELDGYLAQLKQTLGTDDYAIYRRYQAARDHQKFHVTLVNPYEYQTIDKSRIKKIKQFRVTLHGLGTVKKDNKSSYFVVASSSDGQFYRQNLLLKNKDFHVTLGFYPDDVYGVGKGRDTLINK